MLAQLEMIVLKLFSGPQVGGEAVLPPGEYVLGRDTSCDIVIDDILVADEHCRLRVTDDSVELESLGGTVFVEGLPFQSGPVELFDYIMIGGTCFALGTTESQWPTRPLPEIRRETVTSTEATSSTSNPTSPDAPQATANDALGASQVDSELQASASGSMRGLLIWLGLLVGALCITLALVAAGRDHKEQAAEVQESTPSIEQSLWEMARRQNFESDVRIEKSSRGWTVVGYLDKRADRQLLFEEFRKVLPATAIKLWDSESLAESAQGVLSGLHVPLTAKPGRAGAVVIAGTVKSIDQWRSARQRILRDISAIRQLEDQAVTTLDSQNVKEAPRQVAIESTASDLRESTKTGDLSDNLSTAPAVQDMQPPPMVRNVYLLPAEAEAPPRPNPNIRSVSVGACQSLVTTEGTRVMKGGRLDGWMVMEIAGDKIVLERGKFRHTVDLLAP